MAFRKIELLGSPVLREPGDEVREFDGEVRDLVEDMFETMYEARGVGLAAPQVGVSKRVLVMDLGDHEEGPARHALVNPTVVEESDERDREVEGCLSIPGVEEAVERPFRVVVEARDPEGEEVHIEAGGLEARVLQHEIDHLDGILFIDRLSPFKRKLLLGKYRKLETSRERRSTRAL